MSEPTTNPNPVPSPNPPAAAGGGLSTAFKVLLGLAVVVAAGATVWSTVGSKLAEQYRQYQQDARAAEDNAPVGYVGLNFRKTYNDRPLVFLTKKDGRTTLFAAKVEGKPEPDVYDVTESSVDMNELEGGFGRDSIPGLDYPIFDTVNDERGKNVRSRQEVYAAALSDGPRAYPKDLLQKIEMVNDRDGDTPFLVVFDRSRDRPYTYVRKIDGAEVTFGTTGYSRMKQPMLYDRKTRSLWTFEGDGFVCVSGALKGKTLEPHRPLAATLWGEWIAKNPRSTVVVGSDRSKPIPAE